MPSLPENNSAWATLAPILRARTWVRIVVATAFVGCLVWLFSSGILDTLDVRALQAKLRATGPWGALLFSALFVFVQPLGPSGHVMVVVAGLTWSPPGAFLLCVTGAVLGQCLYFLFYRYLARDWAQRRVPARLRRYESVLLRRPFASVFVLRLLTFTWPLAPPLLGVSRVGFWVMCGATLLGLMPGIALDLWIGAHVLEWLGRVTT